MPTYHVLIKGKVQGVFFRASAKDKAEEEKVNGWIRNSPLGDVEAEISGGEEACRNFIEWCKEGPVRAKVEEVIVTPINETEYNGFSISRGK